MNNKKYINLEKSGNASSEISYEILTCKVCNCSKDKSNFYKYTKQIEDKVLHEHYVEKVCKDCLPIEGLDWISNEEHPKINKYILNKAFREKQIKEFETLNNLKIDDLVTHTEAMRIFNLDKDSRRWLTNKVKMGIIKEFKIKISIKLNQSDSKDIYFRYYLPEEITMLKFIQDNGFLIVRGQKSIKQGNIGIHNPPYQFIEENGRQYLFNNMTDRKKTCVICSEYKSFDCFHKGGSTKDGFCNVCRGCAVIQSKTYYDNLNPERKQTVLQRAREWARNNKDKIRLYRKLNRKRPTTKQRIMRNLRKRINDLIQSNGYEFAYVFNTKELIKDKSIDWVGCNYNEFINYIESKFLPGMTWENYGSGFLTDKKGKLIKDENGNVIKIPQWQIDHIKPVHSFDLSIKEERLKLNHYTNLLPMWADDNNWKQGKVELCPVFDKDFLEKYKELEILIKKG